MNCGENDGNKEGEKEHDERYEKGSERISKFSFVLFSYMLLYVHTNALIVLCMNNVKKEFFLLHFNSHLYFISPFFFLFAKRTRYLCILYSYFFSGDFILIFADFFVAQEVTENFGLPCDCDDGICCWSRHWAVWGFKKNIKENNTLCHWL